MTKSVNKKIVGKVAHFFGNLSVAVIELNNSLKIGDKIMIEGATTSFKQTVISMQIERKDIKTAKKGDDIGMKVKAKVRPGDRVYKI
ncbi:MAG: translation elongation factor-like protein [Nanoarchaeota archaeon]|nr:translation elongation factor-like protein [Nanoarchaeota archaeon]MBU1135006.1 translation elongation factor-like protein [Nanoarchaeota archaeon]MBU2520065.1 translation elongation factor-like protein [Nanoarchaeota archaeon]